MVWRPVDLATRLVTADKADGNVTLGTGQCANIDKVEEAILRGLAARRISTTVQPATCRMFFGSTSSPLARLDAPAARRTMPASCSREDLALSFLYSIWRDTYL